MEGVSSRDTFSIIPFFGNCEKRHFQYKPNVLKIMEGVSSRNTFSIISFFENCERCVSSKFEIFHCGWKLWKVSLRDTFSVNPIFLKLWNVFEYNSIFHCVWKLWKLSFQYKPNFLGIVEVRRSQGTPSII